jgi:anaerobic magnesium-protoporphyrin IX monomethyl ester cyclase
LGDILSTVVKEIEIGQVTAKPRAPKRQKQPSNAEIIFVTPPYDNIAPGYEFVKTIMNQSPSLGLLHLAAEVREYGYRPTIIESDILNLTIEGVVEKILETNPKYVGITLFTVGVWSASQISRKIKAVRPETIVIIGGPHVSSMAEETMLRFPEFDYAIIGEGEEALVELLIALDEGTDINQVPALCYLDDDSVRKTASLPIERSLDRLPMPAWDLLPGFPDAYPGAVYDFPQMPVATIAASRGCPFHCKFCDTSTFGARVRAYSPERVFEMIKHLQTKYGVRHILFVDDLFLASKVRTKKLCELILASNTKITWSCTARVDTVKPEILKIMKQAGCWEISFGLESGSNEMLKSMDKSADISRSEQAIKWTAAAGIRVKGLFMLGYPGETIESIKLTKNFISSLPITIMNLTKFTPYPGSPIYKELYGKSIRDDHWQKMNGMNFVWAPEGISIEELDRHYQDILKTFYRRSSIGWHYLKMTASYPPHLLRLLHFLLLLAAAKLRSFFSGKKGVLVQNNKSMHLDDIEK